MLRRTSILVLRRSSSKWSRPSPPRLPEDQQREFEDLVHRAGQSVSQEADLALHPDARKPVIPEFEGQVNPETGERGGPKQEPVRRWGGGEGDWSFKGRVSDF